MSRQWFEVDRSGLAKLLERRGKEFALFELVSNAWDTNAKRVNVKLSPVTDRPLANLSIIDDHPEGFRDLTHAFTLFAESEKKSRSDTRGRFNLGEKLVLALCESATILSTTGGVKFDKTGRRSIRLKRDVGSEVMMTLRMTREELRHATMAVRTLIPPHGKATTFNGELLTTPEQVATFEAELPTEVADADGNLKRSRRKTVVTVFEPRLGETPTLYELGVPVVETEDRWHIDVQQKVPLNMDRDNVPPAFLRELRTLVVNHLHAKLSPEDVNKPWVREATSSDQCSDAATETALKLRFGDKRVAYDPSDPEANSLATSQGYTVVHGGMMNAIEWANAKVAGLILPAGKVTPSPKPFSPDGKPLKVLWSNEYTEDIKWVVDFAGELARSTIQRPITVTIANDIGWPFNAAYGDGQLTINLGRLGHAWFIWSLNRPGIIRLLIHEFGHEYAKDHLSADYHQALCELGARMVELGINHPELWRRP